MKTLQKLIDYSFYLFIFLLPWQTRLIYKINYFNNSPSEYLTFSLYATEIFFGVIIILNLIKLLPKLKIKKTIKNYKPTLIFIALLICLIFNCLTAIDINLAFYKLDYLILAIAVLFIYLINNFDFEKISFAFIFGAIIQSGFALQQFIEQKIIGNKFLGIASQDPNVLGTPVVLNDTDRWLRTFGTLPHPNILAGFFVIVLFIFITLFLTSKKPAIQKILPATFVLIFLSLLTTLSRNAIIAFVVGIIFLAYVLKKENKDINKKLIKIVILSSFILLVFSISFPNLIANRTFGNNSIEQTSNITRLNQYKEAGSIIKNNWLLGTGLGNYTLALHETKPTLQAWQYQPIHNAYLLIWAEIGLVGLFIILTYLFFIVYNLINLNKLNLNQKLLFTVILIMSILALFDHYLWSFYFGQMLFALTIGLFIKSKFQQIDN